MKANESTTPYQSTHRLNLHRPKLIALGLLLASLLTLPAVAQQTSSSSSDTAQPPETPIALPSAPRPAPQYHDDARESLWDDFYTASIACSYGASHSQPGYRSLWGCGGAVGYGPMWFEVGAFSPQMIQARPTGYWTVDALIPLTRWPARNRTYGPARVLPFATAGYTRLFQTANAVDFSIGADISVNYNTSLRIEAKEYASFLPVTQSNAVLRLTLVHWTPDP